MILLQFGIADFPGAEGRFAQFAGVGSAQVDKYLETMLLGAEESGEYVRIGLQELSDGFDLFGFQPVDVDGNNGVVACCRAAVLFRSWRSAKGRGVSFSVFLPPSSFLFLLVAQCVVWLRHASHCALLQ